MGFDIKAAVDGIVAVVSQYYPFLLAGLVLLLLFGNHRIRDGIHKALTEQLAAHAARLHRHRAVAGLGLYHLRRAAQFHQRAAAVGIHLVRHPGGDADRRLAHRRELRRRHEPARLGRPAHPLVDASVGALLGVAFVGLVFYWILHQTNAVSLTNGGVKADMVRLADVSVYFLIFLVLLGMLAFGFRRGGDISTPYVQSLRLIVKNSVLWVMFLASMTASVFFSFDSHTSDPIAPRPRAPDGFSRIVVIFGRLPPGSRFGAPGVVPSGIWLGYSQLFRMGAPTLGARAEDLLMPDESARHEQACPVVGHGTRPHRRTDR